MMPVAASIVATGEVMYGEVPPLSAYPADQRERIGTMYSELDLIEPVTPGPGRSRA